MIVKDFHTVATGVDYGFGFVLRIARNGVGAKSRRYVLVDDGGIIVDGHQARLEIGINHEWYSLGFFCATAISRRFSQISDRGMRLLGSDVLNNL